MFAQQPLHVEIRGIAAVGCDSVHPVEQVVEDLQTLVGHADLIQVGKYQTKSECIGFDPAIDRVQFAADILTRLADQGQEMINKDLWL